MNIFKVFCKCATAVAVVSVVAYKVIQVFNNDEKVETSSIDDSIKSSFNNENDIKEETNIADKIEELAEKGKDFLSEVERRVSRIMDVVECAGRGLTYLLKFIENTRNTREVIIS